MVTSLPYYVAVWGCNLYELLTGPASGADWATTIAYRILGLVGLLELVPSLALVGGLLALLRPQLRTALLERRYKLRSASSITSGMSEILEFVERNAPGVEVKVNQLRFDQTPFIYPLGFRKTGIAIFGQFIRLWRADRGMAKAVLLHELAHYRHGDALLVGAGSPFRTIIERWGKLYIWLFVIPFILAFAAITLIFVLEVGQLMWLGVGGIDMLLQAISHKIVQSIFMLIWALVTSLGILLWTSSIFVVPMTAIWCSELNADQAPASRFPDEILNALKSLPEKERGRQWLLHRLAHPPNELRQWMVKKADKLLGKMCLLLLFPLSFLLQALLLRLIEFMASLQNIQIVPIDQVAGSQVLSTVLLITALLLIAWPFVSSSWERLFCCKPKSVFLSPLPYWLSATILIGLGFVIR